MSYKILIADDDVKIADILKQFLTKEGAEVAVAYDGYETVDIARTFDPDIILLDIMIPGKTGKEVCQEIRKTSDVPIIVISAKSEIYDKVVCLELGADDFVVKPFDINELFARIVAVRRRYSSKDELESDEIIRFENLEISKEKYELKLNGKAVEIPPKELELLYFLASNYNRVFTRDQLLDKVWGFDYLGDSRTVDVHIKRLREKLEGISEKWQLKTVWGVGYKFDVTLN